MLECWNSLQVFNKSVQGGFFQEINKRTLHSTFIRDLRVVTQSYHLGEFFSVSIIYLDVLNGPGRVVPSSIGSATVIVTAFSRLQRLFIFIEATGIRGLWQGLLFQLLLVLVLGPVTAVGPRGAGGDHGDHDPVGRHRATLDQGGLLLRRGQGFATA